MAGSSQFQLVLEGSATAAQWAQLSPSEVEHLESLSKEGQRRGAKNIAQYLPMRLHKQIKEVVKLSPRVSPAMLMCCTEPDGRQALGGELQQLRTRPSSHVTSSDHRQKSCVWIHSLSYF